MVAFYLISGMVGSQFHLVVEDILVAAVFCGGGSWSGSFKLCLRMCAAALSRHGKSWVAALLCGGGYVGGSFTSRCWIFSRQL